MNFYLCVLIFLLIVYFYFSSFRQSMENFDSFDDNDINNPKYYGVHGSYDEINDEFYSFYYDSLFLMKVINP